ncbi:hypothetical protein ACIQUB_30565 [Rhizobium sp. NPDC090275]
MGKKKVRERERVAETIRKLAVPGMKPKALIDAVKAKHPSASKRHSARRF